MGTVPAVRTVPGSEAQAPSVWGGASFGGHISCFRTALDESCGRGGSSVPACPSWGQGHSPGPGAVSQDSLSPSAGRANALEEQLKEQELRACEMVLEETRKQKDPMQYCSLQHQTLLPSPVTHTTGRPSALAYPLRSFWSYASTSPYNMLDTYQPGGLIFQCHIFLTFHTVHGVLKARILKWFAIPFSSGPRFVRP